MNLTKNKKKQVEGIDFLFLGSISNAVLKDLANPLKHDSIMWWLLSP